MKIFLNKFVFPLEWREGIVNIVQNKFYPTETILTMRSENRTYMYINYLLLNLMKAHLITCNAYIV